MNKRLYKIEDYKKVMELRKNNNLSAIKLSQMTSFPQSTIGYWIYDGVKPKFLPISSRKLTTDLAYILGTLKGDGCLTKFKSCGGTYYRVQLQVKDKDFALEFKRCLENWSHKKFSGPHLKSNGSWSVILTDKHAFVFLKSFDIKKILTTSDKIKGSFLRGFFDSEGSVCFGQIKMGKSMGKFYRNVTVCNRKLKLLQFVEKLLFNFGIKTRIRLNNTKLGPIFILHVCGVRSFKKFRNLVGFSIKRKQEKLEKILNSYTKLSYIVLKEDY